VRRGTALAPGSRRPSQAARAIWRDERARPATGGEKQRNCVAGDVEGEQEDGWMDGGEEETDESAKASARTGGEGGEQRERQPSSAGAP
jgi:hypothetical protein